MAIQQMLLGSGLYVAPPGQQAYTTPGTYTFYMPAGIDSVSAVVVAGAGGGAGGGAGAREAHLRAFAWAHRHVFLPVHTIYPN